MLAMSGRNGCPLPIPLRQVDHFGTREFGSMTVDFDHLGNLFFAYGIDFVGAVLGGGKRRDVIACAANASKSKPQSGTEAPRQGKFLPPS